MLFPLCNPTCTCEQDTDKGALLLELSTWLEVAGLASGPCSVPSRNDGAREGGNQGHVEKRRGAGAGPSGGAGCCLLVGGAATGEAFGCVWNY